MSKPSSFRYPQALITQSKKALGKKLRKIIRQLLSGAINMIEGREQGHIILEEQYKEQISIINEVVKKEGLVGITGFESPPYEALTEAKASWSKIMIDTAELGEQS